MAAEIQFEPHPLAPQSVVNEEFMIIKAAYQDLSTWKLIEMAEVRASERVLAETVTAAEFGVETISSSQAAAA